MVRALLCPLRWLLVVVALLTFLIQPGELGTSDTTHRLQVAHSLWTGQPQVFPVEYPEFGVHGRDGKIYAWYGIGQSLLMLPADLVGSAASRLPLWRNYVDKQADPAVRSIIVSVSTNILVNVLTALVAFRLLGLFGFGVGESIAGVMALLCATTHLHYAQNMTENNYIFLLTLVGLTLQYRWLLTGERRALLLGAGALGLNLLTRLTTMLDVLGAACFLLLAVLFSDGYRTKARPLAKKYLNTVAPVYAFFLLLDRLYQYVRFGSWTNTYVSLFAEEQRRADPSLPASFPFNGHWLAGGIHSGLLGPLLSPQKSVFLFDPLFGLALVLGVVLWPRMTAVLRAFFVATVVLVGLYICFYARYFWWAGDFAWGDRYISSAVELASLPAIPLLLRYRQVLGSMVWRAGLALLAAGFAIQCASLAFWLPLEIYQTHELRQPALIVLLRFRNIAVFAFGDRAAWLRSLKGTVDDPWDAAHITTWNFLPSLLRHIGAAPLWAVRVVDAVWIVAAIALVFACWRLVRVLRGSVTQSATSTAA